MTIKVSKSFANMLQDSNSVKGIIDGNMKLFIYKGTVPDHAWSAIGSATRQVTVSNAGAEVSMAASAVDGVLAKESATWDDNGGGVASGGIATFYRLQNTADDGAADTGDGTRPRVQGTIGTGNADMLLGDTTLVLADPFTVNTFTLSILPA